MVLLLHRVCNEQNCSRTNFFLFLGEISLFVSIDDIITEFLKRFFFGGGRNYSLFKEFFLARMFANNSRTNKILFAKKPANFAKVARH